MSELCDKAVGEIVAEMDPGSLVTKYLVIAEALDTDGKVALYTSAHKNANSWDILGLLEFAGAREKGTIMQARRRGEE